MTLKDLISVSIGRIASQPYTNENGVCPVAVRIVVLYPHKAKGRYSDQSLYVFTIFERIRFTFLLAALTTQLA